MPCLLQERASWRLQGAWGSWLSLSLPSLHSPLTLTLLSVPLSQEKFLQTISPSIQSLAFFQAEFYFIIFLITLADTFQMIPFGGMCEKYNMPQVLSSKSVVHRVQVRVYASITSSRCNELAKPNGLKGSDSSSLSPSVTPQQSQQE